MSDPNQNAVGSSGAAADASFSDAPASGGGPICDDHTWVEIELVDEHGRALPDVAYVIEFADHSTVEGRTDGGGVARHEEVVRGPCTVRFPELRGVTLGPAPADGGEPGEWELALVCEDEESGMVLPFHSFRVLDDEGGEVSSCETDGEGEGTVAVDREGEFEVAFDDGAAHCVEGVVIERGTLAPVADATVAASGGDERFEATTDADGAFTFDALTTGTWTLVVGGDEFPIFVDGEQGSPVLSVEPEASEDDDEDAQDWHDVHDADPDEDEPPPEWDIDPDDY